LDSSVFVNSRRLFTSLNVVVEPNAESIDANTDKKLIGELGGVFGVTG
jgi:hypothetical protein